MRFKELIEILTMLNLRPIVEGMEASKIKKGVKVEVDGVVVQVAKREKWGAGKVKIHFADVGNGLPNEARGPQGKQYPITDRMYAPTDVLKTV